MLRKPKLISQHKMYVLSQTVSEQLCNVSRTNVYSMSEWKTRLAWYHNAVTTCTF